MPPDVGCAVRRARAGQEPRESAPRLGTRLDELEERSGKLTGPPAPDGFRRVEKAAFENDTDARSRIGGEGESRDAQRRQLTIAS